MQDNHRNTPMKLNRTSPLSWLPNPSIHTLDLNCVAHAPHLRAHIPTAAADHCPASPGNTHLSSLHGQLYRFSRVSFPSQETGMLLPAERWPRPFIHKVGFLPGMMLTGREGLAPFPRTGGGKLHWTHSCESNAKKDALNNWEAHSLKKSIQWVRKVNIL